MEEDFFGELNGDKIVSGKVLSVVGSSKEEID